MTTHKSLLNICQYFYLKSIQEQSLCLKITVLQVNSIKSKTLSVPLGELFSSEIKVLNFLIFCVFNMGLL